MEIESSFPRVSVAGSMQLIADPIQATPPLALNPFHLLHPDGRHWRHARLGPVTCTQPNPQLVTLALGGWASGDWHLLHDGVQLVARLNGTVDQADARVVEVPLTWGPVTALCCLPRASYVQSGD